MTPKRALWEAFATVCLPSLILWTFFAYLLRTKLNLPYAEALPIYLFLAILPMPLAVPVYRRYLKGAPRKANTPSPKASIALAVLFAVVGVSGGVAKATSQPQGRLGCRLSPSDHNCLANDER